MTNGSFAALVKRFNEENQEKNFLTKPQSSQRRKKKCIDEQDTQHED